MKKAGRYGFGVRGLFVPILATTTFFTVSFADVSAAKAEDGSKTKVDATMNIKTDETASIVDSIFDSLETGIKNNGTIEEISNSDFTNNVVVNEDKYSWNYGYGINNTGNIKKITNSEFKNNDMGIRNGDWWVTASLESIDDVLFEGNKVGISNISDITAINNATFLNNKTGVLNNGDGNIETIQNALFKGNDIGIENESDWMSSGAKIKSVIDVDFIANDVAIMNHAHDGDSIIEYIKGNFIENGINGGAAIYNGSYGSVIIGEIDASLFKDNLGGAIYNEMQIDIIKDSLFEGNSIDGSGAAIHNTNYSSISIGDIVNTNFINNTATQRGGAIYSNTDIKISAKDGGVSLFKGNTANGESNAIYMDSTYGNTWYLSEVYSEDKKHRYREVIETADEMKTLTLNAETGGVIQFDDKISGNTSYARKVDSEYVLETIVECYYEDSYDPDDEYYKNRDYYSWDDEKGDWYREYSYDTYTLVNSEETPIKEGVNYRIVEKTIRNYQENYDPDDEYYKDNDNYHWDDEKGDWYYEYVKEAAELLDPSAESDDVTVSYDIIITGDSTGTVVLNNDVENNPNVKLENVTLKLGVRDDVLSGVKLTANSGTIDMVNNSVGNMNLGLFNLNGHVKTKADVDLYNAKMDRITADKYLVGENASLEVIKLNLLSDAVEDKTVILYADKAFANNVVYTGDTTVAYSPIYKYQVSYDVNSNDDMGYFSFVRGGGNKTSDFNPSVLSTSAATNAGSYMSQINVFNYAFRHSDAFMNLASIQKAEVLNRDKYAYGGIEGIMTDTGVFSPLYTRLDEQGFWLRPYTSFESVNLTNGPDVSNISYGTLAGYDSNIHKMRHGWYRVLTGYLGYNGASQRYSGVDTYLNGGLIGGTTTLYKGNFFNATTLSVGASSGRTSSMYGSEDFALLNAGIANKAGYNIEFKDGKIILQPNLLFSYSFVNNFDYTNAAGVKIKADPLNAFQISPGFKLIFNTKNGWQPYLTANMVFNIMDKQRVRANNVELPRVGMDPYVQYGAGVQKLFNQDKITAFGQVLVTNGGINGVTLNAGIRFSVGKKRNK